jgi:adenylate cyclase class 2
MIKFVIPFPAGQGDFVSIDYNDVVACVNVRGINGLMLSPETRRNKTGQPPQDAPIGIHNEPVSLYFCWLCAVSFHDSDLFDFPDFRKGNAYYPVNALSRKKWRWSRRLVIRIPLPESDPAGMQGLFRLTFYPISNILQGLEISDAFFERNVSLPETNRDLNDAMRHAPLEIEVKFHLSDIDPMRDRLIAVNAIPSGRVFETNIRFENGLKSLKREGILLRLRHDNRSRLTFKSTPSTPDTQFKVHKELEMEVSDFQACQDILKALGYLPEQIYEKWRETFVLDDTSLLIDTMPFGTFLEIEGEKSKIREVANRLSLNWKERILLNYLEIFEVVQREEGLGFADITFDNFKGVRLDINKYLPSLYAG